MDARGGAQPCEAPRKIYALGLGGEDVQADAEAQGAVRKAVEGPGAEKLPSVGVRESRSRPRVGCLTETPKKIPQPPTEFPAIRSEALTSDFADGGLTSACNLVELEQCVVAVAQVPSIRSLEDAVSENQSSDSAQGRDSVFISPKTPSGGNARLEGCAEGARSCEVPRKSYAFGLGGKVAQETGVAHGAVREAVGGLGAEKSPPVRVQQTRILDRPTETTEETSRILTKHSAVELATLISGSADAGSTEGRSLVDTEQCVVAVAQDPPIRSVEDPVSENQSPDSVQGQDSCLILPESPSGHNGRLEGCAEGARSCEVPRKSYAFGLGGKVAQETGVAHGAVREAVGGLGAEKSPPVRVQQTRILDRPTETTEETSRILTKHSAVELATLISGSADAGSTEGRSLVDTEQCVVAVAQDPPIRSVEDPVSENQSPDSVQGQDSCLILPESPSGHNARLVGCAEGARSCEVPRKSYAFGLDGKVAQETGVAHGAVREAVGGLGGEKSPPVRVLQTTILDRPTGTSEETSRIHSEEDIRELRDLVETHRDLLIEKGKMLPPWPMTRTGSTLTMRCFLKTTGIVC
ncbi:hypothetical protein PF001_g25623 [Phytophthora fragariae]|uniref:Uncharacterized protein n=1 Tax=Phytophthora fragariae TaxID=53985 RepID=A0A6A4BMX2_9STRA|nr:hypothetical protein PF001_g25623 [Phytophthora fragariae]